MCSQRLGERVAAARRRTFVGRTAERDLFRSMLSGEAGVAILHVHGPGGTGKTALLRELGHMAAEQGATPIVLDGRELDSTPHQFLAALTDACGGRESSHALADAERPVVLIDTFEQLAQLDPWLRETFVPQLPAAAVLVTAGRSLPAPGWRGDAGLSELCRVVSVRNFTPREAREYLTIRRVPAAQHDALLQATYGHPLALALMADLIAQGQLEGVPALERHPDVVRALLERFVAAVPTPLHRAALEVCAQARVTTESLLAEVLDISDAHALFEWLRGLSFVGRRPEGLHPHDLARDVLEIDFRWRDPDRYRAQHRRIRDIVRRRFSAATGATQQRAVHDKLFLHKRSPIMRPYFDFAALDAAFIDPARPADHEWIVDLFRLHEGPESARIAALWLARQPTAFQIWRSPDGVPQGAMAHLRFERPETEDLNLDPAVRHIWGHVERAGELRPGECLLIHRFWAGRDGYQDAASQTLIAAGASWLWMSTPALAWSFPCTAHPDHWTPMFAYCGFTREASLDFRVGDRTYGVFAHDWRREPPTAWLETLVERELDQGAAVGSVPPVPPVLVLSRPDFEDAVRQALRDCTRPAALSKNPLLRSRLLQCARGSAPATASREESQTTSALQALLGAAVNALRGNPRDEKLYRAVWHTYFQPAETQELAAERLALPFSTFRYHLKGGIERVIDWLWEQELRG